jgi:hypothetical protein
MRPARASLFRPTVLPSQTTVILAKAGARRVESSGSTDGRSRYHCKPTEKSSHNRLYRCISGFHSACPRIRGNDSGCRSCRSLFANQHCLAPAVAVIPQSCTFGTVFQKPFLFSISSWRQEPIPAWNCPEYHGPVTALATYGCAFLPAYLIQVRTVDHCPRRLSWRRRILAGPQTAHTDTTQTRCRR